MQRLPKHRRMSQQTTTRYCLTKQTQQKKAGKREPIVRAKHDGYMRSLTADWFQPSCLFTGEKQTNKDLTRFYCQSKFTKLETSDVRTRIQFRFRFVWRQKV